MAGHKRKFTFLKVWFLFLLSVLSTLSLVFSPDKNIIQTRLLGEEELKLRIGQMIIVGFRGTEVNKNSKIVRAIENLDLGGVILFDFDIPPKIFPRNILNPDQVRKLISDLQGYSRIPLFVAVDVEGGRVNRLKKEYGFLDIPSHKELGMKDDPEFTKSVVSKMAHQLNILGFNMNFAPVVDLNINQENPVIGKLDRSFSSDTERVFAQAEAFISAQDEHNIISVVKHFPGHGSSFQDSHTEMSDVTNSYQGKELIPYKKLSEKGLLKAVMVGHILNKKVDKDHPASLSPKFLNDILRRGIGFRGLILSDDLQINPSLMVERFQGFVL